MFGVFIKLRSNRNIMKVRFFVSKGKNPLVSIHVRFWDSKRIDQKARTGLVVLYDNWNDNKQQVRQKADVKQKDFINEHLRELKVYTVNKYNIDYNTNKYIGKSWLKDVVNEYFNRASEDELYKVYFIDWVRVFVDNAPKRLHKGKPIAKRTIQHYKTTLKKLIGFEKWAKTRLRHEDINLNFYRDFIHYCRTVELLGDNTIGGFIANFKMWCKNIEIDGLPISPQYKHSEFMVISAKTSDIYLSEDEINKVFNFDFKEDFRLDRVRDLFIIGLRTGLRISDFMRIKTTNIKKGFFEITTKKTGKDVVIPIHPQVKTILQKYKGLPRKMSDQKFNEYIKEVCKKVGIDEMVHGSKMVLVDSVKKKHRKVVGLYPKYELVKSHTCRRSFATNLYMSNELKPLTIMAITGHTTESQFLKYIKVTSKEHAQKLGEYYEKEVQEQETKKQTQIIKLSKIQNE